MKVIKRYYYLARLDLVGVVALFVAGCCCWLCVFMMLLVCCVLVLVLERR